MTYSFEDATGAYIHGNGRIEGNIHASINFCGILFDVKYDIEKPFLDDVKVDVAGYTPDMSMRGKEGGTLMMAILQAQTRFYERCVDKLEDAHPDENPLYI